ALAGLLPATAVRPGDSWLADPAAVQELTDLEKITKGDLKCRLLTVEGQAARIDFEGKVEGVGEDGAARHDIEGALYFDLPSRHGVLPGGWPGGVHRRGRDAGEGARDAGLLRRPPARGRRDLHGPLRREALRRGPRRPPGRGRAARAELSGDGAGEVNRTRRA